jgi:hypothetical protein
VSNCNCNCNFNFNRNNRNCNPPGGSWPTSSTRPGRTGRTRCRVCNRNRNRYRNRNNCNCNRADDQVPWRTQYNWALFKALGLMVTLDEVPGTGCTPCTHCSGFVVGRCWLVSLLRLWKSRCLPTRGKASERLVRRVVVLTDDDDDTYTHTRARTRNRNCSRNRNRSRNRSRHRNRHRNRNRHRRRCGPSPTRVAGLR